MEVVGDAAAEVLCTTPPFPSSMTAIVVASTAHNAERAAATPSERIDRTMVLVGYGTCIV